MLHKCSECFRKNKYSRKEHKFFETKNKETFIYKATHSPGQNNLMLTQFFVVKLVDLTAFWFNSVCLKLIAFPLAWCSPF